LKHEEELEFIPFSRPCVGPEEEKALIRVLRSGWLTTAGECAAFEEEFAQYTKAPWALAVNSATSGLHLALEALGIGPGDYVAVSPYTFTASCEVMRYLGAHPAFVDIAPGTFHMDPQALEDQLKKDQKKAKPQIKALMPVHLGGYGLFMPDYLSLAQKYKLPIVEDAAHALPARDENGVYLGTQGTLGVYSFYANKTITTGEGGMIVGQDPDLAKRMRLMRSHGIDRDVWARFTTKAQQWRYAVVEPGFKYNMTDLAAALGREQLKKAASFHEARLKQAKLYYQSLADLPFASLPPKPLDTSPLAHSWHLFTLRITQKAQALAKASEANPRDALLSFMTQAGIGTSVHYTPLHCMPYYQETYDLKEQDYPEAFKAGNEALSLPIYPDLSEEKQQRIIETLKKLALSF